MLIINRLHKHNITPSHKNREGKVKYFNLGASFVDATLFIAAESPAQIVKKHYISANISPSTV